MKKKFKLIQKKETNGEIVELIFAEKLDTQSQDGQLSAKNIVTVIFAGEDMLELKDFQTGINYSIDIE